MRTITTVVSARFMRRSVPHSVSRGCWDRAGCCQDRERCFGADPTGVWPCHEYACGHDGARAGELAQLWGDVCDDSIEGLAVVDEFSVERDDAFSQPDCFAAAGADHGVLVAITPSCYDLEDAM